MASATGSPNTGSAKVDAAVQKVADAVTPQKLSGVSLYSRFALAGAVCCSVTHGALTPVDVYVCALISVSQSVQDRALPKLIDHN